jgi:O-antigen ligase
MKFGSSIFGLLALPVVALLMFVIAEMRPDYFTNLTYLGSLLLLEVVLAAIWHYERWFFVVLMLTFLWAGSGLPMAGAGAGVRWIFLTVGAIVGIVKWAERPQRQHFVAIHLAALLCVLSAVASSMVSSRSQISLLKASSLLFLFLYGSCGARVAVADRQAKFFDGLLTACEITSFLAGVLYVILHFELLGNPNSLGAVMGVVIVPVLLWGVLIAKRPYVRQRRTVALCLAAYLLYSSISRAGILACGIAVTVMCIAMHRQKLLIKMAFGLIFLVAALAVVQPTQFDALASSLLTDVIYKGKSDQGLLGSRQSPWQETADVIKHSPWFGSGFGTDVAQSQPGESGSTFRTSEGTVKEHGSSYLALLQYVGLLGIIPFAILLFLALRLIFRVCSWMWRTADPNHYAIPLAFICLAGLVHAIFEDWLFAVGYYLNIFFWTSVFLLSDLQPTLPRKSPLSGSRYNRAEINPCQVSLSANQ